MKKGPQYRTWIEISKSSIAKNFRVFRSLIPKRTKLMAVVKSNAYGHSLIDFAKEAVRNKADWIAVDSAVEAKTLREEKIKKPILVLGHTLNYLLPEMKKLNVAVTISTHEQLKELKKLGKGAPDFHLKVDTGMHRQGFLINEKKRVVDFLKQNNLIPSGVFSHFASAKNPILPHYTNQQIVTFNLWRDEFDNLGWKPMYHLAATAGTLLFPESHLDMVRVGIGLYGEWPSNDAYQFLNEKVKLHPALTWKTIITEVKDIERGSKIGYEGKEVLYEKKKVAVCPIGYWHGYPVAFSGIARVLVGGKECRVLGRVSMDMISIDISKVNAKVGDEVVLLGKQGKGKIKTSTLAKLADSYEEYEILTRINPLIKRIYK